MMGIPLEVMKNEGRWKSDAFRAYVRANFGFSETASGALEAGAGAVREASRTGCVVRERLDGSRACGLGKGGIKLPNGRGVRSGKRRPRPSPGGTVS